MDEVSSLGRSDLPFVRLQGRLIDCSASSSDPMMEVLGADSEGKHEPVSNIDTEAVDSLKVLEPNRPIREATTPVRVLSAVNGSNVKTTLARNGTYSIWIEK